MGQEIQRLLPDLLRNEVKDPRVSGMVTITAVEVSADLSLAKVFVTVLNPADGIEATVQALNACSAFLRSQLSHTMHVRTVPVLRFAYDESVERGQRLTRLIESAIQPAPSRSRRKKPGGS